MAKTRTMYMHTVRGHPASYQPRRQISIASGGRWARKGITLVPSVAQIKEEQRASSAWRERQGFDAHWEDYGYVRVEVPE